jgi:adenosylcobinamide-GDP ribazoletransferase
MRDPHVGALGAVAVALLLVCKLAFLASLDEVAVGRVLVVMAAVGRWAPVFAAFRYPYAREAGTGKAVADHASGGQLLLATVLAAASTLVLGWRGLLLFAAGAVATVALSAYLARRIGGHTGDTYGFLVEVVEGIVLLGATI